MSNIGISADLTASNYLKDKLNCNDKRVGHYNVLKLSDKENDFERIFVFYDEAQFQYVENLRKVKLLK